MNLELSQEEIIEIDKALETKINQLETVIQEHETRPEPESEETIKRLQERIGVLNGIAQKLA